MVGTWTIRFYERHGFALVSPARKTVLLKSYWSIPERQIETSVGWPIPEVAARSFSPLVGRRSGASRLRSACGQALTARFAHDPRIKSGGRFSPPARGER